MKYALHDLGAERFEDLVLEICKVILGSASQSFAVGRDGGRDVRFVGRCASIPSAQYPWDGTIIAQAKHTRRINASFADADFFPGPNSVLGKEIGAISALVASSSLTHYVLFANRKLAGDANEKIVRWIESKSGLPKESILLQSEKDLEGYLHRHRQVAELAQIDYSQAPLVVNPDEIAEVIFRLASQRPAVVAEAATYAEIQRVAYDAKNVANGISPAFAERRWNQYIKETRAIQNFLADPLNLDFASQYEEFAAELDERVSVYRSSGGSFVEWWLSIEDHILDRDPDIRRHKLVLRALLFYMYWSCDLGTVHGA